MATRNEGDGVAPEKGTLLGPALQCRQQVGRRVLE